MLLYFFQVTVFVITIARIGYSYDNQFCELVEACDSLLINEGYSAH